MKTWNPADPKIARKSAKLSMLSSTNRTVFLSPVWTFGILGLQNAITQSTLTPYMAFRQVDWLANYLGAPGILLT